ncbi:hypothetical protein [Levilactobacillus suantsaii]|uniref:Uncharacterized protein n=1 Tax=Levilactobacillus suantsaii TaxID=2292255 RepID=A0A4Q0VKF0_9LACO|nr:hypothetical protein [Levilactobacillus suantsaii]QMU08321.1 hypothetical protein H3M12_01180 [Levilactobacillus suantsaii]RXI78739.1 hypothetical protein DXH47_05740 [Levilactobacillus suantsaii]
MKKFWSFCAGAIAVLGLGGVAINASADTMWMPFTHSSQMTHHTGGNMMDGNWSGSSCGSHTGSTQYDHNMMDR